MAQSSPDADASVAGLVATARLCQRGESQVLQLTLHNVSSKAITAYRLRWSGGSQSEEHIEKPFPAGGVISLDDPFGPYTRPLEVKVVSAIYNDNSCEGCEGERQFAEMIFGLRRYQASAIEKTELPILKSGMEISQLVQRLRTAALNAQDSLDLDELNAAQFLRRAADKLDRFHDLSPADARTELRALIEHEESLLQVLKTHSEPSK